MSDFRLVKLVDPIQLYVSGTFTPRGAYSAGTDYVVGDMVSYNGSSYIMYVDAVAGTVPSDSTKWGIVASKGDTGATGNTGATGSSGAAGSNGTNGQGVPTGGTTGQVLKKNSNGDYDTVWGTGGGGSGDVATDAIWDAKGDMAVGTGADTASKLTVGANDTFMVADSAAAAGVKWADAATSRTALGLGTAAQQASGAFDAAGAAATAQANAIAASQPLDGDLTTISGLTATTDSFMQAKANAWAARTVAQVKTDLGLTGTNSGDQTITLTGDVTGSGTGSFATAIALGVVVDADVSASANIAQTKIANLTADLAAVVLLTRSLSN